MITEIEIKNFKSIEHAKLKLGNVNLFIGANASGKSNFLDALRVLQGIGYGFSIDEVLNGKPKSATSEVWDGIRGGSREAAFKFVNVFDEDKPISFSLVLQHKDYRFNYEIKISTERGVVLYESLQRNGKSLFTSSESQAQRPYISARINKRTGKGQPPIYEFNNHNSLLEEVEKHKNCPSASREEIRIFREALGNIQRIDPSPYLLRGYNSNRRVQRMGEKGDNFSALANVILSDEKNKEAYLSWLRNLIPAEVEDVTVLKWPEGDALIFAIVEGRKTNSAKILSDGTLRFAAMTAAFFQPSMPDILTIEEIENGIHPSRLNLLLKLFKSRAFGDVQVMATTHSPVILAWLEESDYATTFFCKRNEETGASIIRPLSEIKEFTEIVKKSSIAELFAEGWMEGAE